MLSLLTETERSELMSANEIKALRINDHLFYERNEENGHYGQTLVSV